MDGDIYGLSLEENTYQVEFELFDVLEGVSTEEASDVIHSISGIYSFLIDAITQSDDVSVVVVIAFGVWCWLLVVLLC